MNIKQVKNPDDLRKSVKDSKKKGNKRNFKKVIKMLLLIVTLIIVAIVINNLVRNKKITQEEVTEYNYFITSIDGKSGVIDKTGKTIVEPQYDYVQIPNPSKPIFVCLYDYSTDSKEYTSKVLNGNNKEILNNYKNVQAIPNNNTSINNSYQTQILRYKENDKYGVVSINGKKITPAIYESIETLEYKDGILKVKKDGKYGLIDINGEEIVKAEYNSIETDGYYYENSKYEKAGYIVNIRTDEGYRYGYINYKGRQTLDTMYTNIKRITEIKDDSVVYLITYTNGKAGILKNGQTLIENKYESIEFDGTNNILMLQQNAKQGVYDLEGNMILPIQYENITFAGKYINAYKDGKLLVFDVTGTLQSEDSYKSLITVANGKYSITINRDNKYGVIDSNKTNILENKYSYIEYAFDNYFIVSLDEKTGIVDGNNNIIIPIEKDIVQNIRGTNTIQVINSSDNTFELYNKKMEKVSTQTDARIYIKDNYIEIASANNIEYFDFDGNKQEAKNIFTENKIFAQQKDGKWGYVDKNGNTVVEFKYEMATDINKYGFGAFKLDGKWGVIDQNGNVIKEATYDLDQYNPQFIGQYYEVSNVYQILYYSNE